mgnify:FL=1
MTTGSKERIFPHTFVLDISYDAVGGGRVDVLRCSVCDYIVPVKSHVHDYGWNWDCTGFGSIYEYTFNIGGSTKTVEQLILESGYAHPEKCKVPGCEEFIMVPHSWGRWNVVKNPDTEGDKGGMEAECSVCEYKETKEIDGDWTKDTALVTVKNGRATRMIVKPGDKIRLYPEERTGQKAIGWKVEYRREYNEYDIIPVTRNWNTNEAKTLFKLVTNGSALEWGCTIPEFSAMGAPGGGSFFFEPVYAGCDHSEGTTLLNAKEQVCDRKGYTGDTACADCGHVISAGSDIYPPANAGHTGPLQPLYYYGTANSATTDASHGGKRYNAKSGDCRHRAYEGDYRCTACGGTVKGETGDFRHSGPLELRDVRTATCTERGYSGNQYCTSCDRIAQKGVSTPSLHEIADNYKLINEVKPGCTTSGYSGDQQCTAGCGQIIRYGHVVNKLSHDWDGGKPAKQGKSEGILYTCQRADCGETRFVKNSAATEFTVTVIKGTASVAAGTLITDKIEQNTVVTVTADAPEAGKVFDKWVVLEGNVTLADATKATTTFTMPGNDVKLEATYKDAPPSHTHSYGTEWKYDDTDHWHECECGDKANIVAHSASEWIVDTAATETADGAKHKECTVCKKVLETAPIPATGSSHTNSYGVYVGMTYTAGNLIYQITSIDTATVGQSKVIGVVAAKKNKIKKVTIPDRADCKGYRLNVTTIGNNAFAGCKALEKLTIGNKVTVIGKNAFKNCSKLETVVIGKAVKTISSKAFIGDNKIKKITFKGDKLKTVKKNAFSKKAKKNIKSKKTKLKGNKKAIKLFKKKLKIK